MSYGYKKRTRNALQKNGEHIVQASVRLFNKLLAAAEEPDASPQAVKDALQYAVELLPYVKPKLQAIAQGVLDSSGNIISSQRMQELISIARQVSLEIEPPTSGNDQALVSEITELPATDSSS